MGTASAAAGWGIGLALFTFAAFVAGHDLAARLRRLDDPGDVEAPSTGPLERASAAALAGVAVMVAVSWALALPRLLTAWSLLGVALLILALERRAVVAFARSLVRTRDRSELRPIVIAGAALAPVAVWLGFVLWRSALAFVVNHDAFAYHMPKALQIARAHGFGLLDGPDARVSSFPASYELLLADVILLDGSDALTEWVGTLFYVLFGLFAGALAERAWGRGAHVLVAVLLAMGLPTALLHSGAHKNDLMECTLILGAALFGARWAARGGKAAFVLAVLAVALAVGTKVNGVLVVAGLGPVGVWGLATRVRAGVTPWPTRREVALAAALSLAAFFALGGAMYAMNLAAGRGLSGRIAGVGYGEWNNLWRFPLLAFERPLCRSDGAVWVPWRHAWWFWPRYDHYFASFGAGTTVLLVLVPLGAWKLHAVEPSRARERAFASVVLVATFAALLPVRMQPPLGMFEGFVRYAMFLPPVIALWTAVPFARAIASRASVLYGVLAASSALFAYEAFGSGVYDTYLPIDYVLSLPDRPELARAPLDLEGRAAHVVDQLAGPHDKIAFDGGFASFAYPAYGAALGRDVVYLHASGGEVRVPDDVDWVVIDRAWNMLFNNPRFEDFGQWRTYFMKGTPTPEDMAVLLAVSRDPRFRLVYREPRINQAVFARVRPGEPGAP